MQLWEAIIYGAVQGITEYLPISSSAHLILLPRFMGTEDPGLAFDVFLHAGTLAATLIYFRSDWKSLLAGLPGMGRLFERRTKARDGEVPRDFWKWIAIGTVPALLAGALLHHWVEESLRGNVVLATTLALGGAALWAIDRFSLGQKSIQEVDGKIAVGVGLMQCLALIPGMSRSGSTMMAGRLLGLSREVSARFSFLLSAPVTAAALVFELRKWDELTQGAVSSGAIFVGAVSAFVFGWFAIDILLKIVRRFGYLSFAVYRVILAIIVIRVLGA